MQMMLRIWDKKKPGIHVQDHTYHNDIFRQNEINETMLWNIKALNKQNTSSVHYIQ
jgi:hypothetical protein